MDRAAPSGGYDFGNKRQYRRSVYSLFSDRWDTCRSVCQIALMPSSEGDEIDVALSKGFKEYNLHIIDMNPAIVATLKRSRFPRVTTYGVTVGRAAERMVKDGIWIDGANLDFSGSLSEDTLSQISSMADRIRQTGLIFVAFERARDGSSVRSEMEKIASNDSVFSGSSEFLLPEERKSGQFDGILYKTDFSRLVLVMSALGGSKFGQPADPWDARHQVAISRSGRYQSGSTPMIWGAFSVHRNPCLCDRCLGNMRDLIFDRLGRHKNMRLEDLLETLREKWGFPSVQTMADDWLARQATAPRYRASANPTEAVRKAISARCAEHSHRGFPTGEKFHDMWGKADNQTVETLHVESFGRGTSRRFKREVQ